MSENNVVIIGAGIAGLCCGVYAQQNGYQATIVEMHSQAGGLATAWKRRGYTIDGCIHWLVGSSPANPDLYRMWQEVGLLDGLTFVNHEVYSIFEDRLGRKVHLYADPQRLEAELLGLFPQDEAVIREFCDGVRFCLDFNPPMSDASWLSQVGFYLSMLPKMPVLQKWMKTTAKEFGQRIQDPLLRKALAEAWFPEFSMLFLLMTFAWLQRKTGGYPIGGTMPMIHNVEKRFLDLGGQIHYEAKVEKILVERDRAVGVRLADGRELRADAVVSCADGHATIFDMLGGKYVDDTIRGYYRDYKPFPAILLIGVGVKRDFSAEERTVSGFGFETREPFKIGPKTYEYLPVHVYNYDPTLAADGKTVMTVVLDTDYAYWKALAATPELYEAKKQKIAAAIPALLEERWPGISADIEMVDVATPHTFERYTGNWQGSFEGWQMTPQNGLGSMKRTLPGLENFYMAGHWVMPGGGLPSGVMTGREAVKLLCKKDGKRFRTTTA